MPEWVIVGENADGVPVALTNWVMGYVWLPIAEVKDTKAEIVVFRDRWRAKRQSKRMTRAFHPRALRRDRL